MRAEPCRPLVTHAFKRSSSDAMPPRPAGYRGRPLSPASASTRHPSNLHRITNRTSSETSPLPPATSHPQPRSLICVGRREDL